MTEKEFMVFVKKYLNETILPTMVGKGLGQYSSEQDRFLNFNQLMHLKNEPKEKNLTDLCGKQVVCLYYTMQKWMAGNRPSNFYPLMDELIKDIIVYMFILRGMLHEREQEGE